MGAESAATTPPDDSGVRANTPIQLFLVYSRAARARVELRVYGELLKGVRPAMLEGACACLLRNPRIPGVDDVFCSVRI